ncbi:unnamed protein product [Dicrocoelium dendriticum]|nr:unnamed protein product [Dicrocoelium dendriticum]
MENERACFVADQHIPKAKVILRIGEQVTLLFSNLVVNRSLKQGSNIMDHLDLDEEKADVLTDYSQYMDRLSKELESRIEQEAKAYYWATDIRKRALIELNYTYVPAPTTKPDAEKLTALGKMQTKNKTDGSSCEDNYVGRSARS